MAVKRDSESSMGVSAGLNEAYPAVVRFHVFHPGGQLSDIVSATRRAIDIVSPIIANKPCGCQKLTPISENPKTLNICVCILHRPHLAWASAPLLMLIERYISIFVVKMNRAV